MSVQLEVWHLITLLMGFFAACWAMGSVLLKQFEKRLDERFAAQDALRSTAAKQWEERLARIEQISRDTDRALLQHKADLPTQYVRREDYIRGQSVIEAKIDSVYSKLEVLQIKGAKNG